MVRIAVFDGLIDWWAFGDAADVLAAAPDNGGFPGSDAVFSDNIARFGLTPHDGLYTNGGFGYQGDQIIGINDVEPGAPWACRYDKKALVQNLAPTGPAWDSAIHYVFGDLVTYLSIVYRCIAANTNVVPTNAAYWRRMPSAGSIDPASGWGGFSGLVDTTTPTEFSFNIWAKPTPNGYFISRSGALMLTYLCGDVQATPGSERGWAITANYTGTPLGFNPNSGFFQLRSKSGATIMPNLSLGSFRYLGDGSTDWVMLTITYDSTTVKCYQSFTVAGFGFVTTLTDSLVTDFHINSQICFGARNNTGPDDGLFSSPFNGAFDEALMWNRALTADEVNAIPTACNGSTKGKARFTAVQPETHKLFTHAKVMRGALGTTVAWDVAGLYTEPGEPVGSAVTGGLFQTVWFKWTAPASGPITFITADSSPGDVYSQSPGEASKLWSTLTVWTGTSLGGLTEIVSVDDSAVHPATFTAVAGTEYLIQIGTGKTGENGKASLAWG